MVDARLVRWQDEAVKIGFASVDTTPPVGTYLGGFARLRNCDGVRDRLETTAVWMQSDRAVAWVCADLVFIHRGLAARLRQEVRQRLGDVEVVVACSHSHATPYGTIGAPAARFQTYAAAWVNSALAAIAQAKDAAVAGAIRWRESQHTIGINRRLQGDDGLVDFGWNEEGACDASVGVVEFVDAQGRPLGHVVAAAVHPVVLPPWARQASADWVGDMRKTVREETGLPCGFIQGACADVSPRHEWVPRRFGPRDVRGPHAAGTNDEACRVLGASVGEVVLNALTTIAPRPIPSGPVRVARSRCSLPLTPRVDEAGREVKYWRAVVDAPLPRWLVDRLLEHAFPWHSEVIDGTVEMEVSATRIGGLAICAHGSEPFAATGLAIKKQSPAPFTLFSGYTDGMVGYVPTDAAIPLRGYEVDMVPALYRLPGNFAPGGEPGAIDDTLALVHALWSTNP